MSQKLHWRMEQHLTIELKMFKSTMYTVSHILHSKVSFCKIMSNIFRTAHDEYLCLTFNNDTTFKRRKILNLLHFQKKNYFVTPIIDLIICTEKYLIPFENIQWKDDANFSKERNMRIVHRI